jgi:hypothetical protein
VKFDLYLPLALALIRLEQNVASKLDFGWRGMAFCERKLSRTGERHETRNEREGCGAGLGWAGLETYRCTSIAARKRGSNESWGEKPVRKG